MISPNDASAEIRVLAAVDAAFAAARQRAGDWLACRAGCDQCCRRPFAITQQDARRLREGLATLLPLDQSQIRQRAHQARLLLAEDFPGHLSSGAITPHPEWREWFFARHSGLPCPVLNLESGECRLYAHRPVACRLAGPLIQIGLVSTDPCPLCFVNVSEDDLQTTKIIINLAEFDSEELQEESLIAFVL